MEKECHPLCGLGLEKLMTILLPIFEGISGFIGFILFGFRIENHWENHWKNWKQHNLEIFVWSTQVLHATSLFFMGFLLRKAAKSKNIILLNLWTFFSVLSIAAIFMISVINGVFFWDSFHLTTIGISLLYDLIKIYICFIVHFYSKQLGHEHEMKCAIRPLTDAEVLEFFHGIDTSNPCVFEKSEIQKLAQLNGYQQHFEIDFNRLSIGWKWPLGKGEFGSVYKGNLDDNNYSSEVAVKVIDPDTVDASCFKLILSELKVMTYVGEHPNIVQLIGANTSEIQQRKLFIILEFCSMGNLLDKLKASKGLFTNHVHGGEFLVEGCEKRNEVTACDDGEESISTLDLIKWSHEVSKGMEFLESKRLVHGDLAARNVLLTHEKTAKISDFGLSRQLYQYSIYIKKSNQPVPWMNLAIESIIDLQFSSSSDVWSYGITLFEIFSLGEIPYPHHSFGNQFIKELRNGLRPSCPPNAPNFMYQLMQQCWNEDTKHRPSFSEIQKYLLLKWSDKL